MQDPLLMCVIISDSKRQPVGMMLASVRPYLVESDTSVAMLKLELWARNHRISEVGRDLRRSSLTSYSTQHQPWYNPRLLSTLSSWVLKTLRTESTQPVWDECAVTSSKVLVSHRKGLINWIQSVRLTMVECECWFMNNGLWKLLLTDWDFQVRVVRHFLKPCIYLLPMFNGCQSSFACSRIFIK